MAINIFAGLENLEIKNLDGEHLFDKQSGTDAATLSRNAAKVVKKTELSQEEREVAMLFDKTYTCPVCDSINKSRTVRTGKARMIGMDTDLKPNFEYIEPLKYDVVACPNCGYTSVSRYFVPMIPSQKKSIMEKISPNYVHTPEPQGVFSYEFALERHKMALACAVVRNAKPSERAFTCLKAGWLCRSWRNSLKDAEKPDMEAIKNTTELENEFIKLAFEGFVMALQNERFPICGMDEYTIDYLIAALGYELGNYDVSAKMISTILNSLTAPARMKDKARNLKEELIVKIKEKNNKA